jgi:hypothetical protein
VRDCSQIVRDREEAENHRVLWLILTSNECLRLCCFRSCPKSCTAPRLELQNGCLYHMKHVAAHVAEVCPSLGKTREILGLVEAVGLKVGGYSLRCVSFALLSVYGFLLAWKPRLENQQLEGGSKTVTWKMQVSEPLQERTASVCLGAPQWAASRG